MRVKIESEFDPIVVLHARMGPEYRGRTYFDLNMSRSCCRMLKKSRGQYLNLPPLIGTLNRLGISICGTIRHSPSARRGTQGGRSDRHRLGKTPDASATGRDGIDREHADIASRIILRSVCSATELLARSPKRAVNIAPFTGWMFM